MCSSVVSDSSAESDSSSGLPGLSAEDAAAGAKDIFIAAIKAMTIQDATKILRGDKTAATQYLNKTTRVALTAKFSPIIKASLEKVDATKYWSTMMNAYNKIPMVKKTNPNLEEYVTGKAIDGLFIQIAKEEKEIRNNPAARSTDILKKVFK